MSLQERLENVNEGTMFICFCLFWWIFLVGMRADEWITIPYWAVFIPLWFWKLTVLFGWITGLIVWLRQRRKIHIPTQTYAFADPAVPHIQAMSVSTFFTLLLSCSEIMLCLHLSIPSLQLAYLTILTPLILVGLLGIVGFFLVMMDCRSVFACIHGNRHSLFRTRSDLNPQTEYDHAFVSPPPSRHTCTFTLELYIAINLLQILFLIARLDRWIRSKWTVTFIPTFILLGMGFLFCTVGFIIAITRYFTAFFIPLHQRQISIRYYASHLLINFLLCTSLSFLALRLDNYLSSEQLSFVFICTPVLLSLVVYSFNAFHLGPGNPWWFGLNGNISMALFVASPALQLCANTSVVNPTGFWKLPHASRSDSMSHSDPVHTGDASTESDSDIHSHLGTGSCPSPTRSVHTQHAIQESASIIRAFTAPSQQGLTATEHLPASDVAQPRTMTQAVPSPPVVTTLNATAYRLPGESVGLPD